MKIKVLKDFKLCSVCEGLGTVPVTSHDCWGVTESYNVRCYTCAGLGVIFSNKARKKLVKKAKEAG